MTSSKTAPTSSAMRTTVAELQRLLSGKAVGMIFGSPSGVCAMCTRLSITLSLEQVADRFRRRDAKMPVRGERRDAPARRALQEALLDQVRLDHVLNRVALFADRRGD